MIKAEDALRASRIAWLKKAREEYPVMLKLYTKVMLDVEAAINRAIQYGDTSIRLYVTLNSATEAYRYSPVKDMVVKKVYKTLKALGYKMIPHEILTW